MKEIKIDLDESSVLGILSCRKTQSRLLGDKTHKYQVGDRLWGAIRNKGRFTLKPECPIRLRVIDVRVEQLQDISEQECEREGMYIFRDGGRVGCRWDGLEKEISYTSLRTAFISRWNRRNKKKKRVSWEHNPLVTVITFEF